MSGSPGEDSWPAEAAATASGVLGLLQTVRKARTKMTAVARNDVESASHLLLHIVAAEGPMRASTLAASVHSDLSTVSRQSAALVVGGLLERQSDPADGRASLLALTPAGRETVAEHERTRNAFFAQVLHGWTSDELRQFRGLLDRFVTGYDQVLDTWISERTANRTAQATVRPATMEGMSS